MTRFGYAIAARVFAAAAMLLFVADVAVVSSAPAMAYGGYSQECEPQRDGTCRDISCIRGCGTYDEGCPCL